MPSDLSLPLDDLAAAEPIPLGVLRGATPLRESARTVGAAIAIRAAGAGDEYALVGVDERSITFAQLLDSIGAVARALAQFGLKRQDRVGLLVPAGVAGGQLVVALASSITLVPINPALTAPEMLELAKMSVLKAMVIPRGLDFAARGPMLDQGVTLLEAVPADDGTLRLQLLTPAPGAPALLRPGQSSDVALLLRSSGTTGAPKLIPVTHGNLLAMAGKLGSGLWFGLSARDRAACTLPLYYAAGLKTSLFVPLLLGASAGFPPAGKTFDLGDWIGELKPTYLSAAPGSLNGILHRVRSSARQFEPGSLRFVMCAAAYLPEDLRLQAQALLRVPVLEFYGLSEAGVMAANPVPPGKVKPGTVGLPSPGELLVVDAARKPVASGAVGQIMISGATVMPGYIATDGAAPAELQDGWLLTGDLGRIDEDGYLTIVGREKEVINRGGEKVFPYEVEKAILGHPAVLEAAVYGVPHPRLGENVAAAVVLKPCGAASEADIKEFLAGRLAPYKLPRAVAFTASLPRGTTGKVLRSALAQAHAQARREMVAADRLLELELRDIWESLLGRQDIGIDDDFFEIGGDSLLATEMLTAVESLAGKPYPQAGLATLTIRHMADLLTAGPPAQRDLITQVRPGSGVPLFFCHGDYVSRGIYAQKLAALIPDDRPIYLLNCYADQPAASSLEEIADAYLAEVIRAARGCAVTIGGYCNGGLAAWQLAHLLRRRGVAVQALFLVESMSLNARSDLRLLLRLLQKAATSLPDRLGSWLRERAPRAAWFWRRRIGGVTWRAARRRILSAGGRSVPDGLRQDEFDRADEVYLELMARYLPPPLDVDVTCFIADEGRHFDTDPRPWRRLARRVGVVTVPGTHHTILISGRQALAAALGKALDRPAG